MGGQWSCLPRLFFPLALEIRSLAESGVQPSFGADQEAPGVLVSLPLRHWVYKCALLHLALCVGAGVD